MAGTRQFFSFLSCGILLSAAITAGQKSDSISHPFALLTLGTQVDPDERQKIDEGGVIAKTLPASGHELAIMAAGATKATPDGLISSIRDIAKFRDAKLIPEIGRFSVPPRLTDLDGLTLDEDDLKAIRSCQPKDCDLKLSSDEILRLQRVISEHGGSKDPATWRDPVEREFRQIVLDRVTAYRQHGLAGIPQYADSNDSGPDLCASFDALLQHSTSLQAHAPQLVAYFRQYPDVAGPPADSFLYWSKETIRKPMIGVTHTVIVRNDTRGPGEPAALVASREVFSTRYTSGGLSMTMLVAGSEGKPGYLVYLNRSWVDGVHALWRPIVEWIVKRHAPGYFKTARERIEAAS